MESDDDLAILPSSPVLERKLKRLKKASKLPEPSYPPSSPAVSYESRKCEKHFTVSNGGFGSDHEDQVPSPSPGPRSGFPSGVTVKDDDLGAKRVLDFDSVIQEHEKVDGESQEVRDFDSVIQEHEKVGGESQEVRDFDSVFQEHGKVVGESQEVRDLKAGNDFMALNTDEVERKRRSLTDMPEKKKKRIVSSDGSEKKSKESAINKRKAEKERRETMKNLRAESQRLLRETRDAAFKPAPLVQKPISLILDKIRQRKLEILKKSSASSEDDDDNLMDEGVADYVEKDEPEEMPATCPTPAKSDSGTLNVESGVAKDNLCSGSILSPTAMGSEPEHAFRAPIGDTQELFSDSERSETKEDAVNEKSNNPSEEVFAPSLLSMNLKLDSACPDDDDSSDEEDNDKENVDPLVHGSVHLTLLSNGDPVRAFVDEEAEEEDDSDHDLQRFQDTEGEEDNDDDIEELNDMIATQCDEKPNDKEKRDQLHQQWLQQQDTAGVDSVLRKLNCGSKLKETPSVEEEDEESRENESDDDDEDDEAEEYAAPAESLRATLKKMKQMIPQMFSDKDDKYVSSDDEETEKLARQRLYYKTEEKATFFSPAEDESSKGVFSLIKKLNVPDTKRKGRTTSIFAMPTSGQNIQISSKSSFVGRASDRFMPTSGKHGSCKVRSFVFGRDDSDSRSSYLMSEDSSDAIPRESQPPKAASTKFQRNTQNQNTTSNSTSQESNVSLLDILRKSSHLSEHSLQNSKVQPKASIFDAFKLVKKPTKA
ncbi:transcriptional regulator ATRX isoform X2 [Vigna radiata var. radiata]|uniref:Transcriptional regulator ATRX isoform X2 n=1 Tax=Vigna radiata var. radiata TaxID=3916 RepID=A0A1S3TYH0_VIGRR|nr:transcriptional regulator ATRX isoform X2 [Vigna radiata var. radiata]